MGRPPSCSCACGNAGSSCSFSDNFSSAQSGYQQSTVGGTSFSVGGGQLAASGVSFGSGSYYRLANLAPSGLRSISVQANCYAYPNPPNGNVSAGVGLEIPGDALVFKNFYNSGSGDVFAEGRTTDAIVSGSSGDLLAIEAQEVSTNVWDFAFLQNGSLIGSENNVPWAPSGPVVASMGDSIQSMNGVSPAAAWKNFAITCADTSGCPVYSSVPVVWQLTWPGGTLSAGSVFRCAPCSAFSGNKFLYFLGSQSGGTQCVWESADRITCQTISGNKSLPLWHLVVTASGAALYAAYNPGPIQIAVYQSSGTFQPLGANVLSLVSASGGGCTTFPSTVTIQPAS